MMSNWQIRRRLKAFELLINSQTLRLEKFKLLFLLSRGCEDGSDIHRDIL